MTRRLPEHIRLARLYWRRAIADFLEEHVKPLVVFALVAAVATTSFSRLIADALAAGSTAWTTDGVALAPSELTDTTYGHQYLNPGFNTETPSDKPLAQLSGGDYVFAWYDQTAQEVRAQRVN